MFKETVLASQLIEDTATYLNMAKDTDVVQIMQKGQPIKVLMSQTHYLNLLARLSLYEKNPNEEIVPGKSPEQIMDELLEKRKQLGIHLEDSED